MAPSSLKSNICLNKLFSTPCSRIPLPRAPSYNPRSITKFSRYNFSEETRISFDVNHTYETKLKKWAFSERGSSLMTFSSKEPRSNQDDPRALETVLRLYAAIKNRNVNELSDIIGDECLCICNFVSRFQPFHGKKEVMEFFSSLIGNLGNNFEFIVQPTLHDGMTVGVSWSLECSKSHVPLGKGFSFYICHSYQGKVIIRNVEMFMEPLLHIEPLRLKMMGTVMNIMAQIALQTRWSARRKTAAYFMCFIVFIVAFLLWQP